MKEQITQSILSMMLVIGCYQKNLGPKADVVDNGADGHWKLSSYFVRGKPRAITNIPEQALLKVGREVVNSTGMYPSTIYQRGYSYRVFLYSDLTNKNTSKVMAISYSHNYSKKRNEETHWFRVDDDYGFQITLDVDREHSKSTRMEMTNVMKSGSFYRAELDTARYIYVPN